MAVLRSAARVLAPIALLALFAQCRSRTEIELPLPEGTALVVQTAEPMMARRLLRQLGATDDANLPEGTLQITLQSDGRVATAPAKDATAWLRATIAPGPLLAHYKKEIDAALPTIRGAMTLALQGRGMQPREIAGIVDELLSWPEQVATVAVRIDDSPLQLGQGKKWSAYTLTIRPKADTPLMARYRELRQGLTAPPTLPGSSDALVSIRCSLHPDILKPLFGLGVAFAGGNRLTGSAAAALSQQLRDASDGTLALTVDPKLQITGVFGLRDATAAAAAGDATRDLLDSVAERAGADFTPAAVSHRAVELARVHSALSSPFLGKEQFELFAGRAGNWSLLTLGGDRAFAKGVVDAALDDRVHRSALRQGAIVQARFDLAPLMELMTGVSAPPSIHNMLPKRASMTVHLDADTLTIEVRVG